MAQATALTRPPAPAPSVAPSGDFLGTAVDRERRRGRGTLSNASGRYEPTARIAFDDGWQSIEELPAFETTVTVETARTIITRNDSPDIGFDRSINPYRGCEHGCVYCFARPDARQHGALGRARFRIQAVRQAGRAGVAGARTLRAALFAARDRHRHQHRSLSADRAALRGDARHSRSAGASRTSGRHRHQIGAGHARHRHSRPHGAAQSGEGRALGDQPRRQACARDGAARGHAAEEVGHHQAIVRGRHPDVGDGRAGHPGDQRHGDRAHPRRGGRLPAQRKPVTCCCACRSNCATCSASG